MTESMLTTRLSSVITGCGGNDTTCSRRSINGLSRSTNGTSRDRPGSSVRAYRPSRSTTPARACGTIRTERRTTTTMKNRTARKTMPPAVIPTSSFRDERRGAVDLQDFDAVARLDDLVLVIGAGAPDLAADL